MTKQELAAKIWEAANKLRKNIKASEYKNYIIGFMFYKFLSEKEEDYLASQDATKEDLKEDDYRELITAHIGYYIGYDDLYSTWKDMGTALGAKNVSDAIENFYNGLRPEYATVFKADERHGVFDALDTGLSHLDENAGSRDKAVRDIVNLVDEIPPKSESYDTLGYVYEYLIKQFSSEAKKDGAFYTPESITILMSRIIMDRLKDRDEVKIYDPCIGSAGLLLHVGEEAQKYMNADRISYYGQDLITETANIAKMNLFMNDIPIQNIHVRNADTLDQDWPDFKAMGTQQVYNFLPVDACSLNPPYSQGWNPEQHTTDARFRNYGLAPAGKADYAFLLHAFYHLKQDGIMTIILPHGVLFRGDSEYQIRKRLLMEHDIEAVIGLPSGCFFATGIPVCILVLSKGRKADDVLFVDASQSYVKEGKQNVIKESMVQKIFDVVKDRKSVEKFSRLVSLAEVEKNDYNLNIPRYVSAAEEADNYDFYAVMTGKIYDKELERFNDIWKLAPGLRGKLLDGDNGYSTLKNVDIAETVDADEDVRIFKETFRKMTNGYKDSMTGSLIDGYFSHEPGTLDKNETTQIYEGLKDKLFAACGAQSFIDRYSLYQVLADKWTDIEADLLAMKHDPNIARKFDKTEKKNKKGEITQVTYTDGIIPFDMVKYQYFANTLSRVEELQRQADDIDANIAETWEELGDDDKQPLTKDAEDSTDYDEKKLRSAVKDKTVESSVLESVKRILSQIDEKKEVNKKLKQVSMDLDMSAAELLTGFPDDEIKKLLAKKWIEPLADSLNAVMEQKFDDLERGLKALSDKYKGSLRGIDKEESACTANLKQMLGEFTGSDKDMEAVKMLMEELR